MRITIGLTALALVVPALGAAQVQSGSSAWMRKGPLPRGEAALKATAQGLKLRSTFDVAQQHLVDRHVQRGRVRLQVDDFRHLFEEHRSRIGQARGAANLPAFVLVDRR